MAKHINVLQIGKQNNLINADNVSEQVDWYYIEYNEIKAFVNEQTKDIYFQVVLITTSETIEDILLLDDLCDPYTVLFTEVTNQHDKNMQYFYRKKQAQFEETTDFSLFIAQLPHRFFTGQYGERFHIQHTTVSLDFTGEVVYNGYRSLELSGFFGDEFTPIVSWKYNLSFNQDYPLDLWPEFEKDETVTIQYVVRIIQSGSTDHIAQELIVSENELNDYITITGYDGYIAFSVQAKGSGTLKLGPIHSRLSRLGNGVFLVGGQRIIDHNRQEIAYYFHPGDMKPPLNVYFSGYRSAEGFEGYWMMKNLGAPFLLITDPRLEGGAFYLGSELLEKQIEKIILDKLDWLGFSQQQLILSGISMGTFGALFNATKLSPYAVVVSKPLLNLGDVAINDKYVRPGMFSTALDILAYHTGELSDITVKSLNDRFWNMFTEETLKDTKIYATYMIQDDYDSMAYPKLVKKLKQGDNKIVGRGFVGRHTDLSATTTNWFYSQYWKLMVEDFKRKEGV